MQAFGAPHTAHTRTLFLLACSLPARAHHPTAAPQFFRPPPLDNAGNSALCYAEENKLDDAAPLDREEHRDLVKLLEAHHAP